jgi:protein-tyrosine phosphatase
MMASMRNWLKDEKNGKERVVVVHCKAGKGRSGTSTCSYLISEEGWSMEDALKRFTERRMRVGFGAGVSIPSQLRWVRYVTKWAREMDKVYMERKVEVVELHVWGLRDGVKVAVEGYVEEGKKIKTFHIFKKNERIIVDDGTKKTLNYPDSFSPATDNKPLNLSTDGLTSPPATVTDPNSTDPGGPAVVFHPSVPIILTNPDINIDFERRNKAAYTGWTMVTSVAHVWFNPYFEGGDKNNSGVFEIEWDALDGIKGSARKGARCLDRLAVIWRYPGTEPTPPKIITEPKAGEPVVEGKAADWRGEETPSASGTHLGKDLGLRTDSPISTDVSRASSLYNVDAKEKDKQGTENEEEIGSELEGVRTHGPNGEEKIDYPSDVGEENVAQKMGAGGEGEGQWIKKSQPGEDKNESGSHEAQEKPVRHVGLGKLAGIVKGMGEDKLNDEGQKHIK